MYSTADSKICRSIPLHIEKRVKGFTLKELLVSVMLKIGYFSRKIQTSSVNN